MHGLRSLELTDTTIGDAGVKALSALPALSELSLVRTPVTGASVPVFLAMPALTRLDVRGVKLARNAVRKLRRKRGLTVMSDR